MIERQDFFLAYEKLNLFYRSWRPDGIVQAALAVIPGAGDHSGRYARLVTPLVARGFAVYAFDMRGFGQSPGRKGHIGRWNEYREDARAFLALIRQELPAVPVFLFGYSLGAAVALDLVLRDPSGLRGVILSATPIAPVGVATRAQIALARMLSRIWPTFTIQRTNAIEGVSRDPAVLEALRQDPLQHNWVTARWGAEALAAMNWVQPRAAEIRLSVLFLHGSDDPFNLASGTQQYYEQVTYPDKTLKIYPGSRHETHNDLDHAQVAADIGDWMAERAAPGFDR